MKACDCLGIVVSCADGTVTIRLATLTQVERFVWLSAGGFLHAWFVTSCLPQTLAL